MPACLSLESIHRETYCFLMYADRVRTFKEQNDSVVAHSPSCWIDEWYVEKEIVQMA